MTPFNSIMVVLSSHLKNDYFTAETGGDLSELGLIWTNGESITAVAGAAWRMPVSAVWISAPTVKKDSRHHDNAPATFPASSGHRKPPICHHHAGGSSPTGAG